MIESIDLMCRIWGVQKRRILSGRSPLGDEDGWSRETLFARIREMQEHAGAKREYPVQKVIETYTNTDALTIHRAAHGMPENLSMILFVHYVVPHNFRLGVKRKAAWLNVSVREYWVILDRAHHWLAGRVEAIDGERLTQEVTYD